MEVQSWGTLAEAEEVPEGQAEMVVRVDYQMEAPPMEVWYPNKQPRVSQVLAAQNLMQRTAAVEVEQVDLEEEAAMAEMADHTEVGAEVVTAEQPQREQDRQV